MNISVLQDAAKQFAQIEARDRALLEGAPDAMVVMNERGEIVMAEGTVSHERQPTLR